MCNRSPPAIPNLNRTAQMIRDRFPRIGILATFLAVGIITLICTAIGAGKMRSFPITSAESGSKIPCGSCAAPAELSSDTTLCPSGEPGESLEISGTIYFFDGVTPVEDAVLFLYQTDANGYFNRDGDPSNPRLRGWVKTAKDGHYRFHTVRPGPYLHRQTPAHIHVHIYGAGIREHAILEYRFADDPRLSMEDREEIPGSGGSFAAVVTLRRNSNGVWEGVRDIKLDLDDNRIVVKTQGWPKRAGQSGGSRMKRAHVRRPGESSAMPPEHGPPTTGSAAQPNLLTQPSDVRVPDDTKPPSKHGPTPTPKPASSPTPMPP